MLYLSFSQTINEEKDAEGGQHRDLPRFVYLFSLLFLDVINSNPQVLIKIAIFATGIL